MSVGDEEEPVEQGETDSSVSAKSFTQEELTTIAAREKGQGKRQGQREVLEALGVGSIEEAKDLAKVLKDAEAAQLSEGERLKREAEAEKSAAKKERDEAKKDRFSAKVERRLIQEGIDIKSVGKVSRLVEADVDSTDEDLDTAIADLRESMPQLFSPPGSKEEDKDRDTKSKVPSSDPGKQPKPSPGPGSKSAAQARLQQRHGAKLKTTNN